MQAWGRVLGRSVFLTTRLRSRYCGPPAVPRGLDRLPQLLWPDVFARHFSRYLPDVRPGLRRQFCSLALGVLATKGSYLKVAAGLGLPANDSLAHHLNERLRTDGHDGAFYDSLVATADWLNGQTLTVDYGARRTALAELDAHLRGGLGLGVLVHWFAGGPGSAPTPLLDLAVVRPHRRSHAAGPYGPGRVDHQREGDLSAVRHGSSARSRTGPYGASVPGAPASRPVGTGASRSRSLGPPATSGSRRPGRARNVRRLHHATDPQEHFPR